MRKEIAVKGKMYRIESEDIFTRKNILGRTTSWRSYTLVKGHKWITIGLGDKPLIWERQSKLFDGKFNPKVSGTLFMNHKSKPNAFIYSFDISKTKFFAIERFPDGREFRLIGKVL